MRLKRYEILLPLRYNDGGRIEKQKFAQTQKELLERFGGVTMDSVGVTGSWIYQGVIYEDRLMRMVVDAEGWEEADRFFRDYKGVLKERFEQLDIWIVAYEIEII